MTTLSDELSLTAVERWSFIGYDLQATQRFYTEVLRRPLVYAQTSDYLPGSDELAPGWNTGCLQTCRVPLTWRPRL